MPVTDGRWVRRAGTELEVLEALLEEARRDLYGHMVSTGQEHGPFSRPVVA